MTEPGSAPPLSSSSSQPHRGLPSSALQPYFRPPSPSRHGCPALQIPPPPATSTWQRLRTPYRRSRPRQSHLSLPPSPRREPGCPGCGFHLTCIQGPSRLPRQRPRAPLRHRQAATRHRRPTSAPQGHPQRPPLPRESCRRRPPPPPPQQAGSTAPPRPPRCRTSQRSRGRTGGLPQPSRCLFRSFRLTCSACRRRNPRPPPPRTPRPSQCPRRPGHPLSPPPSPTAGAEGPSSERAAPLSAACPNLLACREHLSGNRRGGRYP